MKNYIKGFGIIVALLYSMNALAGGTVKVNGVTVETTATGLDNDGNAASASIDVGSGKCTLTITPGYGKYITVNDISAIKTIDGSNAQTRTPEINTPVAITASDETADPSGTTTYTFAVTDENYDYEVTANFQDRTSVEHATVTVAEGTYTYDGSPIKPEVTVTIGDKNILLTKDTDYKVYYKDSINAGTGKVIIEGIRKYNGSQGNWGGDTTADNPAATYTINPKSIAGATITLTPESSEYNGENQKPEVSVKDGDTDLVLDTDYTLTNEGGTDVGKYAVTITGKGNYDSNTTASKDFNITALDKAPTIELANPDEAIVYDGTAKEPAVKVSVVIKDGDEPTILTLNTDYTVDYSDNVNAGTNTAKATVTLKGNYKGTGSGTFTIAPKSIANVSISDIADQAYTGSAIQPTVTVKDGDKTLEKDKDYTISYSNNTAAAASTAENAPTVIVTGKGNYDPNTKATKTFTIGAKSIANATITLSKDNFTYNGQNQKPEVSVKDGETDLVLDQDYTLTNVGGTNVGEYTVTVTGKGNYDSETSASKNFNITAKSIANATITLSAESFVYNGQNQKPEVSVKDGDKDLVLDQDYTLVNEGGTDVGEYTVTITGKGNYDSETSVSKNFNITAKSIADATITLTPENFVYNGQSQKPEVSVKDGETDLVLDQDYTLMNEGGTDVGEYTVTITGKGNYDSETSVSKKYYITVEALEVTAEGFEGTYDKAAHGIKVNAPEGATIKYGTSEGTYALDNSPTYTNVGEYTVYYRVSKVNAADVTGSATVKITPAAATISFKEATVEKKPEDAAFTNELTNTGDGAVTYQSSNAEVASVNENTGEVTIKGSGEATITATVADGTNYTYETKTATYTITVKSTKKDSELSWTDPYMGYVMGTFWWGPRLNNPNNLEVKYESSDEDIATIDEEGVVTAVGPGECYIRAIFEGNDEYEAKTVSYLLEITKEYKLWVGTTQVTSENAQDILGDGHFFYDEENDWLIVTDNDTPQVIESRMNDLFLYANGSSRLERVWFNNADNSEATGRLTIISYMNIPGSLYLATSHPDGVISGFSSLNLDDESFMYLLDPMDGVYNGKLMTKEGDVAQAATISQYLRPLVNGHTVVFPTGEYSGADLRNVVIHDILNTMVQHQGDSDEDDDYYDPAESAIVINNVNTTSGMSLLLFNVEKGDLIPGSDEYAVQFRGGLTFMVPEGEGKITLDLKTEPRFRLMLMVGPTEPYEIEKTERGEVEFEYKVDQPTYCLLFLQQTAGTRGTRIGKRDRHHGTIYSIKVEPTKVRNMNPLGEVEGYPSNQKPEVVVHSSTGIKEIKVEPTNETSGDDSWYDMQGRKIDKPTKAGIYIQNRKKIVIR